MPIEDASSAWQAIGECRWLQNGGPDGAAAVELQCVGEGMSAALQVLKPDPPRKGGFVVTAWMRCDELEEGGDVGLWLDVQQKDGPPLWGRVGIPNCHSKQWQPVAAEVRPTKPVTQVDVYLILRDVKGRVSFADIRIEDMPVEIRELAAFPCAKDSCDIRAGFSEEVVWNISAIQEKKEIRKISGDGVRVSDRFPVPGPSPITITVRAERNNQVTEATAEVIPRTEPPLFDWWVTDSLTRVFQDDLPPPSPRQRVELDVARGERESFQICLRSCNQELRSVTASASDLSSASTFIPASHLQWHRVGYVWVSQPMLHPHSPRREPTWWPDPLLPAVPFSLDPEKAQSLWFTLHVPRDAPPGEYAGNIRLAAPGEVEAIIPVNVRVHPAVMPVEGTIKTAFALMDGHLRKIYGRITPPLPRAYTDFLLAHRLNPDDISRTSPPDLNELEYADTRGLNAFNILNVVPEPTTDVLWVCYSPPEAYTTEFRERFFERLDEIVPELEQRGLLDKAYVYGFDERGEEYFTIIRDIFGEIKRRYPEVHTLSTCRLPPGMDPLSLNIDWCVPLSSNYNHQMAQDVRSRGGEVWWYVCMGPREPYANWLLEHPLIESRIIFWQAFAYNVEGFLYWGLNIWEREHNDTTIPDDAGPCIDWSVTTGGNYPWLNGDGILLYPGKTGPIGSVRLDNIRDGLEDADLLSQYRKRFGADAVSELLNQVVQDRAHYSRDRQVLLAARKQLLEGL